MKIAMIFLLVGVVCAWAAPLSDESRESTHLLDLLNRFLDEHERSDRVTGTVKWAHDDGSMGLIEQENGPDVRFRYDGINGFFYGVTLVEGQKVIFTVEKDGDVYMAVDIDGMVENDLSDYAQYWLDNNIGYGVPGQRAIFTVERGGDVYEAEDIDVI